MKVKDVMTADVKSLKPNISGKEALDTLFSMQISGLPVIDEQGKLAGMFTEKDVLSYILPSYIEKVGRFVYEQNPKATNKKFTDLNNIEVSKLMRKDVVVVDEDTTLCEVARVMLTQKARRVPVIDKNSKVVGMVARVDVLKALAKEAQ